MAQLPISFCAHTTTQPCRARPGPPTSYARLVLSLQVHFMAQRGQLEGQLDKTGWMVESPLAFCARLGSSMDEYEAFVRSWSMRAAAMAGAAGRAQLC